MTYNVVDPDESNRQRVFGADKTRSRTSFPASNDGRDGDRLAVINGGKMWICEKVRGKWHRQEFGSIAKAPTIETQAKSAAKSAADGKVGEAPIDGNSYFRMDGAWVQNTYLALRDVSIVAGTLPDQTVTIDGGTL